MRPGFAIAAAVVAMAAIATITVTLWPQRPAPPAPPNAAPDSVDAPPDSLLAAIAAAPRDSVRAAEARAVLGDWESAWQKVVPGFSLDSLHWIRMDSLRPADVRVIPKRQLDSLLTGRHGLASADRRYVLDPQTGRMIDPPERPLAHPLFVVFDLHAGTQLTFEHGPPGHPFVRPSFHWAGWIGDRRFATAGLWPHRLASEEILVPALWIYDLDSLRRRIALSDHRVTEPEVLAQREMLDLLTRKRRGRPRRSRRAARSVRRALTRTGASGETRLCQGAAASAAPSQRPAATSADAAPRPPGARSPRPGRRP